MPRPNESAYPGHPAHIIHHEYCGHVLRRVLKPDPADKTQTGCICDMPPEEIWQTKRMERGGATCEIDELTYEARSLPVECNACLEDMMNGGRHYVAKSGHEAWTSKEGIEPQRVVGEEEAEAFESEGDAYYSIGKGVGKSGN
ncbi:hypothetical protein AA313_de0209054 [Arthrobotrys entomopaga]|nr:hypothetical protein AA313_de0209054 [Arthrobotrys entomopaga]